VGLLAGESGHIAECLAPFPRYYWYISKNITLGSVRSVHLTHLTLERKSGTRTQPPYHAMHLTQPDVTPNPQDTPDAAPNTQDTPDAAPSTQDAPDAAPNTQDAI